MNIRLVETGWAQEFADAASLHGDELRIICPFIKRRTIETLLRRRPKHIQVITRFNLRESADGVNDIEALQLLLNAGANIRGIKNLHAKLYLFSADRAIVTSANLTHAALHLNHEFGLVSDNSSINATCRTYFDDLWSRSGKDVTALQLHDWNLRVQQMVASSNATEKPTVGPVDFGTDIGIIPTLPVELPIGVAEAEQAFVKFLGENVSRVSHSMPVLDEIQRARCDILLSYPTSKTPRQVEDGALMFIGRLVANPLDIRVFGRAFGLKHVPGRDEATEEEKDLQAWRRTFSKYIRVYQPEFVAGRMENGVSLRDMMNALEEKSFASTKRNVGKEGENTDPRLAYLQQPSVELSEEGQVWLNSRFQAALLKHGKVPQADIDRIAGMSTVTGTVTDLGRPYADGARNFEIHTPVSKAAGLPYEKEKRKEIRLTIADVTYEAGIRATERNTYVWICPDIVALDKQETKLGRVLANAGFVANDRVLMEVDGDSVRVKRRTE